MPENNFKYSDLPIPYTVDYGILTGQTAKGTKIIFVPIVMGLKPSIADDSGKMPARALEPADKVDTQLGRWDDVRKIDMLIADALTKGIRIPEPQRLKAYLSKFPNLIEILSPVCKLTREKFQPENTQLSLEVTKDFSEDTEYLILYVRQEQYDEQIMEKIDDVCSTYGEKLIGKHGWLLVTTDFCPPR
jgi:hypothetical protein